MQQRLCELQRARRMSALSNYVFTPHKFQICSFWSLPQARDTEVRLHLRNSTFELINANLEYFTRQVYLEPAITAFCQTLAAFRGDLNASQEFIDEQKAAISALQSVNFWFVHVTLYLLTRDILQHENLCIQWQNSVRADRYQELRDIRVKRTEA